MFSNRFSRRKVLGAAVAAPAMLKGAAPDNLTVRENRNSGTPEWQLRSYRFDTATGSGLRSPSREGYASDVSAYPGERIGFMFSRLRPGVTLTFTEPVTMADGRPPHAHMGPVQGKAKRSR